MIKCPECGIERKDNRTLGLHRRTAHGVPGAHHLRDAERHAHVRKAPKVASKALVPVANNHKPEFARLEDFVVLQDASGHIWLAERIK